MFGFIKEKKKKTEQKDKKEEKGNSFDLFAGMNVVSKKQQNNEKKSENERSTLEEKPLDQTPKNG